MITRWHARAELDVRVRRWTRASIGRSLGHDVPGLHCRGPADHRSCGKCRQEREHKRKVRANEDEVIQGAKNLDRDDKSPRAEYVREVTEDIQMRRAGADPQQHMNPN